ncbi:NB-ARC domain-containing protein [Herbihabitans rhizosphaerae]|uniref:NB-ARC domain-containing protein n=1 Tax=Herbihabitans rhizosphaerae TaxID=1872711 RepID=A0A4Q7L4M4_9PSEU|nr:NB-ARC domain-containing protein [Herbihabitans rhizosphaerae]RZS43162.1 NB-ARC domain-containing protein [Herbihabitans rhizosphaerae]
MSIAYEPQRAFPFLDRDGPRREMAEVLDAPVGDRARSMFLTGPIGIGTTALASEFCAERATEFQTVVWVPASDLDGNPVPFGELLGSILARLGVPVADQSPDVAGRLSQISHRVWNQRALFVFDDVDPLDSVKPLLDSLPAEAVVVVTTSVKPATRGRLGFVAITLDALPDKESREKFDHCLGDTAAEIDASVRKQLVERCHGSPLLIEMLAAQLVGRAYLAEALLEELPESAEPISPFLDAAYRRLDGPLRATYRWLAQVPGPDFDIDTAAFVLGQTRAATALALARLDELNLLTEYGGRFAFHGFVRADARQRARDEDDPGELKVLRRRIAVRFLDETQSRDHAISDRWRVGDSGARSEVPSRETALTWFHREWRGVATCVRLAHEIGEHEVCWRLCVALYKYLHMNGHVDVWIDVHEIALESARDTGATEAVMQLSSQLGAGHLAVGELERARQCFTESLEAAGAVGSAIGRQSALEWLGKVDFKAGDVRSALARYDESDRAISEVQDPDQALRARATVGLQRARAFAHLKSWQEALDAAAAARAEFAGRAADAENVAKCDQERARALVGLGRMDEALTVARAAADQFERDRARRLHGGTLMLVGDIAVAIDDLDTAERAYETAADLFEAIGDARELEARAKLAEVRSRRR